MSIIKWHEITYDTCRCGQHFQGSIKSAEEQFKDYGGIIINKKHYCDKFCVEKYNENKSSKRS